MQPYAALPAHTYANDHTGQVPTPGPHAQAPQARSGRSGHDDARMCSTRVGKWQMATGLCKGCYWGIERVTSLKDSDAGNTDRTESTDTDTTADGAGAWRR